MDAAACAFIFIISAASTVCVRTALETTKAEVTMLLMATGNG